MGRRSGRLALALLSLVLLILNGAEAQPAPSFCAALKAFITSPPQADGFQAIDLADVSFVGAACVGTAAFSDTTVVSSATVSFLPPGLSISGVALRRAVVAYQPTAGFINIEVTLALSATAAGSFRGSNMSASLVATMMFKADNVPLAAVDSFPVAWVGKLETFTEGPLSFLDGDLFDGVAPVSLTSSAEPVQGSLLDVGSYVATLAGDFNINLGGLTIAHPSLAFPTVRGAFIGGANPLSLMSARAGSIDSVSDSGVLVQQAQTCVDTECPSLMSDVLRDVVVSASLGLCNSPSPVLIRSARNVDMFVSPSTIAFRAASAVTEALFACGKLGYVGMQLRVENSWQPWPARGFLEDNTTAASLTKARSPWLGGFIWGSFNGTNRTFSFVKSDIFGIHGGGRLVLDAPLTLAAATSFISELHGHLNTGVDLADAVIDAVDAKWHDAYTAYVASTIRPTWNGFLEYYADAYPGFFEITFGPPSNCSTKLPCRPSDPVMDFALTLPAVQIPSTDAYIAKFDKIIGDFAAQVSSAPGGTPAMRNATVRVVNATASTTLFVSYVHRVRINGSPAANRSIVTDELEPQLYTAASLVATYKTGLFSSINVTIVASTTGTNATSIRATIGSPFSTSVGSSVSSDSNGNLVTDLSGVQLASFQDPLNTAAGILGRMEFYYTIAPLSINPGKVVNATYIDLITTVYHLLSALQSIGSSQAAAYAMEQQLVSQAGSSPQSKFMTRINFKSASVLEIDMRFASLQMVTVKSSQLLGQIDVSELLIPTVVQTRVLMTVPNTGADPTVVFELRAAANYSDFTLPISFSMNAAACTSSNVGIVLALPGGASFMNMKVEAKTDMGATVHLDYESEHLGDSSTSPTFLIYGEEQVQSDPLRVFADVQNLFLLPDANLGGALDAPFYPWADAFGKHMKYKSMIRNQLPWLLGPRAASAPPAQTSATCLADLPDTISGNFTVNSLERVVCDITVAKDSYDSAVASMNIGLAACGLNIYLNAYYSTADDETCARFILEPKVTGVVYQFVTETNLWRGSWALSNYAEFGSWADLPIVVGAVVPQASISPVRVSRSPSSAYPPTLVAMELRPVFSVLTSVEYDVSITYDTISPEVNASQTATTEDAFHMDLENSKGEGTINMIFSATVRSLMDLPVQAVCVSTNFTGADVDKTSSVVPEAPYNTLTLYAEALLRTTNGTTLLTWEGTLTLTPGISLLDALTEAAAEQPADSWLTGMLNVTHSLGDVELGIADQVIVCLNLQRYPFVNGSWLEPLEMAVMAPMPYFAVQSLAPPNAINAAIAYIDLTAKLEAVADATNTTVGVVQFSTPDVVVGSSTILLSISTKTTSAGQLVYRGIGSLSNAAQKIGSILSVWEIQASTNLTWTVRDIEMAVDDDEIGASQVVLSVDEFKRIDTVAVLQKVNDISLTPTYSSPAIERLAQMGPNPFCNGLSTIMRLSDQVTKTELAQKDLPFTSHPLAPLFAKSVRQLASLLAERVCKSRIQFTIATFCALIEDAAGFAMCDASGLTSSAFTVLLKYTQPDVSDTAAFVYDFAGYSDANLVGNKTKAIGMDANFNLYGAPTGTVQFLMDLAPAEERPMFVLGEETAFQLSVTGDLVGELSARLGPARVLFTGTYGSLDLVMNVQLSDRFKGRDLPKMGVEHVFVGQDPVRGRRLAVRQGVSTLPAVVSVTGSASFAAGMMRNLDKVCQVDTNVPDLARYFSLGGPSSSIDSTVCYGGTQNAIDGVKTETSPVEFWGDVGMIQSVLSGGLKGLLDKILGPKLSSFIFPLISNLAQYLLEPLYNINSPKRMNNLSSNWQNTVTGVQRRNLNGQVKPGMGMGMRARRGYSKPTSMSASNKARELNGRSPRQSAKTGMKLSTGMRPSGMGMGMGMGMTTSGTMTMGMGMGMGMTASKFDFFEFLGNLFPQLFTTLLCEVFKDVLRYCPSAPAWGATKYQWNLPFYAEKIVPIGRSTVHLGDHGFADLGWDCSIRLVLSWDFTIALTYSKEDGLDLIFPTETIMSVAAKFETVPGCELSGKLLFVGFSVKPYGSFEAELTLSKGFDLDLNIYATLWGTADIGFAGPIAKALTGDPDAITALPHLRTTLSLSWLWNISQPITTPSFQVTKPQLCLGTILTKIVGGLAMQVKKIMDPLAPIIGPDGILLRRVAIASYLCGRETNMLDILTWVAKYFCSIDECTMEGVVEAIKVAAQVYRLADRLASMSAYDPSGCGAIQAIDDFDLDFHSQEVGPVWTGPSRYGKGGKNGAPLIFPEDIMDERDKTDFEMYWKDTTKGDYCFNLDIMESPISKLITVLLGGRVPVASFTLPPFQLSVGASWGFIVWPWPIVEIIIGLEAGIIVDIGKIALLSDGIINAFTSGNIGQLVTSLAIPTKNPNGLPHYPLKAYVRVSAGVEISILIFRGGVQLYLRVDGGMGFSSVNGDDWITFAEIWNLLKFNNWNPITAMDKILTVTAGINLYIKACIPFPFKKICVTIVNFNVKWVLWSETWKGNRPPPIADDGGRVQLGAVKKRKSRDDSLPLVELHPNSANGLRAASYSDNPASTFPPIARDNNNGPVGFDGAAEGEFTLYLHGITQPVIAPSGQPYVLRMDTASYAGVSTHSITPTMISPSITVTDCSELTYDTLPALTTVVYSDGAPCPSSHASVESATFVVKGAPEGYTGKPITIRDAVSSVEFTVPTTTVKVSGRNVWGAPDVSVNVPPPVPFLTVSGHPVEPTTYHVLDSVAGSLVKMTGGLGSDVFITRLSDNRGTVLIDGAGQGTYANWMNFTVDAQDGDNVTVSPYVSVQKPMSAPDTNYTVHHSNTPRRTYNVNAAPNQKLYMQVSSVETSGLVDIHTRGAINTVVSHELLSCNDQSELRVYVNGPGQHLVIIGDGTNTLANFGSCTVRVLATSEPGQDTRIILNQGMDGSPLHHIINTNSYSVRDPTGAYLFSVTFTGVDWLILNAGLDSQVTHQAGTVGTETVIHFPDGLNATTQSNSAIIENWTNAVIVNGTFMNVTVGMPADPRYSVDPFQGANALLAINAQMPDTEILLVSGQDQDVPAPAQRFQLSQFCFDPLDLTLTKAPPLPMSPSADMLNELLTYNSYDPSINFTLCHVAYKGPVHFIVRTGGAADWFNATQANAPVDFYFNGGDDIGIWSYSVHGAYLNADMGEGRDKLMLGLPMNDLVSATLGEEMQVDSVDIFLGPMLNPNIQTSPDTDTALVTPIGLHGETLSLYQYRPPYDLVHIRQGMPGAVVTNADISKRDGVVYINAGSPGEVVKVDLQTGTSYELQTCAQDTTVVLDPGSTDPSAPPAANFVITVRLATYTQSCYILIPAAGPTESLVNVYYTATVSPNAPNFVTTMTEMSAFPGTVWTTFGGTRIQSTYIDHFYLDYSFVPVNLTIDGTAGADVYVLAPPSSWVLSGASRFAGNALIDGPSLFVSGPSIAAGNLIVSSNALSVTFQAPAGSSALYDAGQVSFSPEVTPVALFTEWFTNTVTAAGFAAALANPTINVYVARPNKVVFDAELVSASNVGPSIVANGVFQVINGDLELDEGALTTPSLFSSHLAVQTATEAYQVLIDPGRQATVLAAWAADATLAVACVGAQLQPRWVFSGFAASSFAVVTPSCAATVVNQAVLPAVTISQPASKVSLTSTMPAADAPFNLAVAVTGDDSAYTLNFVVAGAAAASPRDHSVSLNAANSTLVSTLSVSGVSVAPSTAVLTASSTTDADAIATVFSVVSADALNVSASGSLIVNSANLTVVGDILPFDLRLNTVGGIGTALNFAVSSPAGGVAGAVNVTAVASITSLDANLVASGVAQPASIGISGTIGGPSLVLNVTGDATAVDIAAVASADTSSTVAVYYNIFGDANAADLVAFLTAANTQQALAINVDGSKTAGATKLGFGGSMTTTNANLTVVGDLSPLVVTTAVSGSSGSKLYVAVNVQDDTTAPLAFVLNSANTALTSTFNIVGDNSGSSSIIGLSGSIGLSALSVSAIGDLSPMNVDYDLSNGAAGSLSTLFTVPSATNFSVTASLNSITAHLTVHGSRAGTPAVGFTGSLDTTDIDVLVVGDMSDLANNMQLTSDQTTADINLSVDQNNVRDLNITTQIVAPSAIQLDVQITGVTSGVQQIGFVGTMGQRTLNIAVAGVVEVDTSFSSIDDRVVLAANGASPNRAVDIDVSGSILPVALSLSMVTDSLTFGVQSAASHASTMQVVIPDPFTPGLVWSLNGSYSNVQTTLALSGGSSLLPLVTVGGQIVPTGARLQAYGDIAQMNTTLSVVQTAAGLFAVDAAVIGADNHRDVNVTVDNTVAGTMDLAVALVGDNQGARGQLVSVVGTMDQRTLDVEVIGKTPLLLSVLSRDATLAVLSTSPFANAADLTVAINGVIRPVDFALTVQDGDDLLTSITAPTSHTLNVTVAVPDPTTPGLSYVFAGSNRNVTYALNVLDAFTAAPAVSAYGSVSPANTVLQVYGDISTLNSSLNVAAFASSLGVFSFDSAVIGSDSQRDLNVTVANSVASTMGLAVSIGGLQSPQLISVTGTMDQRTLDVEVIGETPVLLSVSSVDANLAVQANAALPMKLRGDAAEALSVGINGVITPLTFTLTLENGNELSTSLTAPTNHTLSVALGVTDASAPALAYLLSGSHRRTSFDLNAVAAADPTITLEGALTPLATNLQVYGDITTLASSLIVTATSSSLGLFNADIAVIGADGDDQRHVNVTVANSVYGQMALNVTTAGEAFGSQFVGVVGTMDQRTLDVEVLGATPMLLSVSSVDSNLTVQANSPSQSLLRTTSAEAVSVGLSGLIRPLTFTLTLENSDELSASLTAPTNHTLSVALGVTDLVTPGLSYLLSGSHRSTSLDLTVVGAATSSPAFTIGGSLTPLTTNLEVHGDISTLSSSLQITAASPSLALFNADIAVISADNQRNVNVTVANSVYGQMGLNITTIGSDSPYIGVIGTMDQRTLDVEVIGATPMQLSVFSLDSNLTVQANSPAQSLLRTTDAEAVSVGISGLIRPLTFALTLENSDELSASLIAPTNHTLRVALGVTDKITPGLSYLLSGSHRSTSFDLTAVGAATASPTFTIGGALAPLTTNLEVYGDISTLSSSLQVNATSSSLALFNADIEVLGPDNQRDVNVTVANTVYGQMALNITTIGSSSQYIGVIGTMDQRALSVEVIGATPMLLSVSSVDSNLTVQANSPAQSLLRTTDAEAVSVGISGLIRPLTFALTLENSDELSASLTAPTNHTLSVALGVTDLVTPGLSYLLSGSHRSTSFDLTVVGATTYSPTFTIGGALTPLTTNLAVYGDISTLSSSLQITATSASLALFNADIAVIGSDNQRDVNVTVANSVYGEMALNVTTIGFDSQYIGVIGTMDQRTLDVEVIGATPMQLSVFSLDSNLTVRALAAQPGLSGPLSVALSGLVRPVIFGLTLEDGDDLSTNIKSTVNHTLNVAVFAPSAGTPGLTYLLGGAQRTINYALNVQHASTRTPSVSAIGTLGPLSTGLQIYGDISSLTSNLRPTAPAAAPGLFSADIAVIGSDNRRDVNVTVANSVVGKLALNITVQGALSQYIGVIGTMDLRSLDVEVIGQTPVLLSVLSRDDTLAVQANSSHPTRPHTSPNADLTVAISGVVRPVNFALTLANTDDLTVGLHAPNNHSLAVVVTVPSATSPGLEYSFGGFHGKIDLDMSVTGANSRSPLVTVSGSVFPLNTYKHVYGDTSSLVSTISADTTPLVGLFNVDLAVIGADNNRDVNITVSSSMPVPTTLAVAVIGQASPLISVAGTMDQREMNVNVTGATPMLLALNSRDSALSLAVNGNAFAQGSDRNTLVGVAAVILPMELGLAVTGDALSLSLVSNALSTSTFNVTFDAADPARALTSVLSGQNSAIDLALNVAGAASSSPTVILTGGSTTRLAALNVTGGGVSQLLVDLDVLGDAGVTSGFDLALAPLAAGVRTFNVQGQPITAVADGHVFVALDLALITKKTFDLKLMDANNTLLINTSTVVPTVYAGGSAILLINNTDESSSLHFPERGLLPDWPRDVFRPMEAPESSMGTDCLQPLSDCNDHGWVHTAVVDALACPNRTCTRTSVVLTTPFDVQCPAYGVYTKSEWTVLVNPIGSEVESPYYKWTFYFAVVMLAFAWITPIVIWCLFGYLYWHLWAELVICGMLLFAQPHAHPMALSLLHNFNYGVATAFLFNCFDLRNLSILSWTAIAACATIVALYTIERLGNPRYKKILRGVVYAQRFLGGWLFFFVTPIALANIWTCGVEIGTRLFFSMALAFLHIIHRTLARLMRKAKALHLALVISIPVAAFSPLVLVGWGFGYVNADVSFSLAVAAVLVINVPTFVKSWFWHQNFDQQWPWQTAATIGATVFGLVFVSSVYSRAPSASILTFLMLWVVTAVGATVAGRVLVYIRPRERLASIRPPPENIKAPLLSNADLDPSL